MAGQSFRTTPAPNLQPALYQLAICAPGAQALNYSTYTFPISPSAIRYDRSGASSHSDVQGPPSTQGITRVMDRYGLTPPTILIEGTTGWDYHATDGSVLTGLQSMKLLEDFLTLYASLNAARVQSGNATLYTLEFYDYFRSQFWQVEPEGPQMVRLAADRPILSYYRFRWIAVRAVRAPVLGEIDALLTVFGTPPQVAALNAATTIATLLTTYTPVGEILP